MVQAKERVEEIGGSPRDNFCGFIGCEDKPGGW